MAHRIRAEFNSPAVQGKLAADERRALTRRATQAAQDAGPQTAYSQGNAAHLAGMRSEQLQVIRQQDNALDKLAGGLDTLHEMANVIDGELKDQDKILEDITIQTDAAQNKMDQAIAHIEKLIGKPGCCSGNSCQLCVGGRGGGGHCASAAALRGFLFSLFPCFAHALLYCTHCAHAPCSCTEARLGFL